MANYCTIQNKKNTTPKQLLSLIGQELNRKFKLKCTSDCNQKEDVLLIEIKKLIFPIYVNSEGSWEFFDVPSTALSKFNGESNFINQAFERELYYYGLASSYAYLYEYIKNWVAKDQGSDLESDGAGTYPSFERSERFYSFSSWLAYYEKKAYSHPSFVQALKSFIVPSMDKIIKEEQELFPELFPKI